MVVSTFLSKEKRSSEICGCNCVYSFCCKFIIVDIFMCRSTEGKNFVVICFFMNIKCYLCKWINDFFVYKYVWRYFFFKSWNTTYTGWSVMNGNPVDPASLDLHRIRNNFLKYVCVASYVCKPFDTEPRVWKQTKQLRYIVI